MKKKLYIYLNNAPSYATHSFLDTEKEIYQEHKDEVHTTELLFARMELIDEYDLFIVKDEKAIQFYDGMDCGYGKELRKAHALYKLVVGGHCDILWNHL